MDVATSKIASCTTKNTNAQTRIKAKQINHKSLSTLDSHTINGQLSKLSLRRESKSACKPVNSTASQQQKSYIARSKSNVAIQKPANCKLLGAKGFSNSLSRSSNRKDGSTPMNRFANRKEAKSKESNKRIEPKPLYVPSKIPTFDIRGNAKSGKAPSPISHSPEVYPGQKSAATSKLASKAFPKHFSLCSAQKHVPKQPTTVTVDTVYANLFAKKKLPHASSVKRKQSVSAPEDSSCDGNGTDSDMDETSAARIKECLAKWLAPHFFPATSMYDHDMLNSCMTVRLTYKLVVALRFEDYRLPSPQLDILRALYRRGSMDVRRQIALALADATSLRFQDIRQATGMMYAQELETTEFAKGNNAYFEHGHGFLELLRYLIEHKHEVSESAVEIISSHREKVDTYCIRSFVNLWRTFWIDSIGSDEKDLLSCAGQIAAYMADTSIQLLQQLLHYWPHRFPKMQIVAVRIIARVMMTSTQAFDHLLDNTNSTPSERSADDILNRIFKRIARCIESPHLETAWEALAFTKSQFVLYRFASTRRDVYALLTTSLHRNSKTHWNEKVRQESEEQFDQILDFATFV